jgi:hypothetical protein
MEPTNQGEVPKLSQVIQILLPILGRHTGSGGKKADDGSGAVNPNRIGLPISQERTRHTPHLSRHQADHREAEMALAQPAATASCGAKRQLEIEVQTVR